jgi:hypothetical protein
MTLKLIISKTWQKLKGISLLLACTFYDGLTADNYSLIYMQQKYAVYLQSGTGISTLFRDDYNIDIGYNDHRPHVLWTDHFVYKNIL